MSLQLSPKELAKFLLIPLVPEQVAPLFQHQPSFTLGLRNFLFISQTITNLERELERQLREQHILFDSMQDSGLEPIIEPLIQKHRRERYPRRNHPYSRPTCTTKSPSPPSHSSKETYYPPTSPSSRIVNDLLQPSPSIIDINKSESLSLSSFHSCNEFPLGSHRNPIVINDETCEGCTEDHDILDCSYDYRLVGEKYIPIRPSETPKMEQTYRPRRRGELISESGRS